MFRCIDLSTKINVVHCEEESSEKGNAANLTKKQREAINKIVFKQKTIPWKSLAYTTKRHHELPKLRYIHEGNSLNPPVVNGDLEFSRTLIRERAKAMAAEPAKAPVALSWEERFDRQVRTQMKYELLGILKKVGEEIRKSPHNPTELAILKVLGPKRSVDDFSSHWCHYVDIKNMDASLGNEWLKYYYVVWRLIPLVSNFAGLLCFLGSDIPLN